MRRHVLIDTNVLVTAVDPHERDKARTASLVIEYLSSRQLGAISTQVVVEFYATTTRPKAQRRPIFKPAEAVDSVGAMLRSFHCIDTTSAIALAAVEAARKYQLNVYDALLWSAASAWELSYVVTEDMQSRPWIEGVRFVDPYSGTFRFADIGL